MIDRDVLEDLAKQAVTNAGDEHNACLYQLWDTMDETPDKDLVEIILILDPSLLVSSLS